MRELDGQNDLPRDATQEEIDSLVHEVADIPLTAWLLSFTGAAAQFARFGITVAWRTLRRPTYTTRCRINHESRELSSESERKQPFTRCSWSRPIQGFDHSKCILILPVSHPTSICHHIGHVDRPVQDYGDQLVVSSVTNRGSSGRTISVTDTKSEERFLILGYVVLFATALPSALDHGAGLGGLAAAMVLSGIGQGGLSAVLYPFIGK
jgi:hypothetical protein